MNNSLHVLIIKTSSMGDILHLLPALTDAGLARPGIQFDWVVEENFKDIPRWHPLVDEIIPVAWRRWRKHLFSKKSFKEFFDFYKKLRTKQYDLIIDAQGLIKSAVLARLAKGRRIAGWSFQSARDPLAALFYQDRYVTAKRTEQHAVARLRELLSKAIKYPLPLVIPDYGIDKNRFRATEAAPPYLVFLHGTTWNTKHWPEEYWISLVKLAANAGYRIKITWGNDSEKKRATRIQSVSSAVDIMPRQNMTEIAAILASATAVVAVDTGLGHLAAALDVPTLSLYGPTDPRLTGAMGKSQHHLCVNFPCSPCLSRECKYPNAKNLSPQPPCFGTLQPTHVWEAVKALL